MPRQMSNHNLHNNKENYPPRPFTPISTKMRTLPLQSLPSYPQYEHSPSTTQSNYHEHSPIDQRVKQSMSACDRKQHYDKGKKSEKHIKLCQKKQKIRYIQTSRTKQSGNKYDHRQSGVKESYCQTARAQHDQGTPLNHQLLLSQRNSRNNNMGNIQNS